LPDTSESLIAAGVAAVEALASPIQVRLALTGRCEAAQLRAAWATVVQNHQILRGGLARSGYANGNGERSNGHAGVNGNGNAPNALRVPWQEYDLRELSRAETQNWISSFLETDHSQKMLAGRAPILRTALLRIGPDYCELVCSIHPFLGAQVSAAELADILAQVSGATVRIEQSETRRSDGEATRQQHAESNGVASAVAMPSISASSDAREASDTITEQLTAVWESVLKTSPLGPDDDFFEAGGHSLLAARLLAKIEQVMGVELPLASLLEAPTIRQQASLIRNGKLPASGPVENNLPKVSQLPLFYLGGDPTFRPLSRKLSELREFHSLGLHASLLNRLKQHTLEAIAEQFVTMIRERRPHGPYLLAGWCAHGLLAYEVATQLKAQGEEVAQVLMLETVNPVRLKQYSGWRRVVARVQLKFHLLKFECAYLQQLNSAQAKDYIAARASQKVSRIKQSVRELLGHTADTDQGPLDVLYRAASRYYPKPYDGRVMLIRSLDRTLGFGSQLHLGWDDVLGEVLEVCETPGNHYTIYMEPNVDTLARKMDACLKNAEQELWQAR
jgi:thioesterase domain-containing protein/acyl carrier protein